MARKKFEMLISPLDVTIPTWLAVGALLQMLLMLILPRAGVTLLPIFYILYRVIKVFRDSRAINTKTFTSVKRGRWTAELPVEGSTIPEEVICMVLAARINHPLGKAAPGVKEVAGMLQDVWAEAEANREKYGFLSRTNTLFDILDRESPTMMWVSYWADMDKLHEFARGPAHSAGQLAYVANKFPNVGVAHEVFKAPRSGWETVYHNMPPLGLGRAKPTAKYVKDASASQGVLHEITRPEQQNMFRRMRGSV